VSETKLLADRLAGKDAVAEAEEFAGRLKALASWSRLRILALVTWAGEEGVATGKLTTPLGLAQPTIVHHVQCLEEAGLVMRNKRGRQTFVVLDQEGAALLAEDVASLAPKPARAGKSKKK